MGKYIFNDNYKFLYGVSPDGWLCKKIQKSKHFFRNPPVIAIDKKIFDTNYKSKKIKGVKVFETEEAITYIASLETFIQFSILIDRGFGVQYALPLKYWTKEGEKFERSKLFKR